MIDGTVAVGFEHVRATFERGFAERDELGAAVSVIVDGESVVDLWGGHRDVAGTAPWTDDTLVNVWSTTKGMVTICAHRLAQDGLLDLDRPIAEYWPEFAAAGKGHIPVRWLLSHRAGMAAWRSPVRSRDLYDWDGVTALLAAQAPWWEPGTASGYHAVTYGFLVGEVLRRVSGASVGELIDELIATPLGIDLHVGLDERHHDRVAELVLEDATGSVAPSERPSELVVATFSNPRLGPKAAVSPEWRRAEIPAVNGHATASAIAAMYAALVTANTSERLLDDQRVEELRRPEEPSRDLNLGTAADAPMQWAQGVQLNHDGSHGPNPRSFRHGGWGGSLGFADPEARIGFGYVMNRMNVSLLGDTRARRLVLATYQCLGEATGAGRASTIAQ